MDVEQPGGTHDLVIRPTRGTAQRAAAPPPPTSGQTQQRGLFGDMFPVVDKSGSMFGSGGGGQAPEPAVCLCRGKKRCVAV